jgi:hypothetical protein
MKLSVLNGILLSLALAGGIIATPGYEMAMRPRIKIPSPRTTEAQTKVLDYQELMKDQKDVIHRRVTEKTPYMQFKCVKVSNPSETPGDQHLVTLVETPEGPHGKIITHFKGGLVYAPGEAWLHLSAIHPRGSRWCIRKRLGEKYSRSQPILPGEHQKMRIPTWDFDQDMTFRVYWLGYAKPDDEEARSATYARLDEE